jgi:hypothetical protein
MQEKRIDAELDFKILRGERQGLTEQRPTAASTATAVAAGWFKRKRERTTPAAA